MAKLTKTQIALMTAIAAADGGILHVAQDNKALKVLVDGGFAETNAEVINDDGIATRLTQAGHDQLEPTDTGSDAPADAESKTPTYAVETGTAMIKSRRSGTGGGNSIYPFAELGAPEGEGEDMTYSSFFVPATEARPDPCKTMQSTVATASKKYATQNGTRTVLCCVLLRSSSYR